MFIERMSFNKESKEKKGSTFKFIRFTLAICAIVFVIAFFVTIAVNNKKANNNLTSMIIPTYEPFTTYEPIKTVAPVDLVGNVTQDYEDDAPIPADKPVMAAVLEWQRPANGDILVGFSKDDLVYNRTMNDWRVHLGVDFSGNIGASVMAAADGTVTDVGTDDNWGTYIEIKHADGYVSRYCNLQANPPIKKGETVTMGQIIGGIGTTAAAESADPPHLHFEVLQNGKLIDPTNLFN